jgi:hypothetical protein
VCRVGLFLFVLNFVWCVDDRILALERDLAKLRVDVACSNDPRLFFFSGVVKSRRGQHSAASVFHKNEYKKCVFCGSKKNLTLAHLITEIQTTDESAKDISFDVYGPPTYKDRLDTKSSRNFLRLCGTKGMKGTCHDMFDNFRLSLMYNPFRGDYQIFSVDSGHRLHMKRITLSEEAPPYRRLLCWRFKKALLLYGSVLGTDAPAISDAIDFSDTTSSVRRVDNEIMSSAMSSSVLPGDGKPIMVSKTSEKKTKNKSKKSWARCYKCYERGHLKKDCPK